MRLPPFCPCRNPLDDYNDSRGSANSGGTTIGDLVLGRATESVAVKFDKANEAIQMLNDTREFWSATWEEVSFLDWCFVECIQIS